MTDQKQRFNVLVCIDGSQSAYQGLRYAIKFSLDNQDTDISLLYVRPMGGGSSEGLNMDLARENMLDWDLELPGLKSLKTARDILVENGFLGEAWETEKLQKKSHGSRLGDHIVSYVCDKTGQHISLIVRTASSVLAGILDEAHYHHYNIVIVSTGDEGMTGLGAIDSYTAISVATEHDGTVILARELEEGHGHLVCMSNDPSSIRLALMDAEIAARCGCPIHLYAIAQSDEEKKQTQETLDHAKEVLEDQGYVVSSISMDIGDPTQRIIENGKNHSLIVMATTEKSILKRIFLGSVSHAVLKKAKSSVMIIR